jgi:hypothetical protein
MSGKDFLILYHFAIFCNIQKNLIEKNSKLV